MTDKILMFLDASSSRAAVHCQRLSEADRSRTMWVRTVPEALSVLVDYRERLEEASLEYDLGEEPDAHPSREDCGLEIVRWLEKQNVADYKHIQFIIHSWNISAALKMVTRLTNTGYMAVHAPFGMRK